MDYNNNTISNIVKVSLVVAGVVGIGLLIYVVYNRMQDNNNRNRMQDNKRMQGSAAVDAAESVKKQGESLVVETKDYDKRIEYWKDQWKFGQRDAGKVEFDVQKSSGVIVALSSATGYPRDGYAVILDEHGSKDIDPFDNATATSYVARLPNINGAAASHAIVRGSLLGGKKRHVVITYQHGYVCVNIDGQDVLKYTDPFPSSNIHSVGFGSTGLQSGVGYISNLIIS